MEPSTSIWTPAMLTAIFGGIGVIITALGAILVQLRKQVKDQGEEVVQLKRSLRGVVRLPPEL